MFAGVYRVFTGKSKRGDFKFMGIACIPTILAIFDINILCGLLISTLNLDFFFKFPCNFWRDFRQHVIPTKITCMLLGTLCNMGFPRTFYGGKICSVPWSKYSKAELSWIGRGDQTTISYWLWNLNHKKGFR